MSTNIGGTYVLAAAVWDQGFGISILWTHEFKASSDSDARALAIRFATDRRLIVSDITGTSPDDLEDETSDSNEDNDCSVYDGYVVGPVAVGRLADGSTLRYLP